MFMKTDVKSNAGIGAPRVGALGGQAVVIALSVAGLAFVAFFPVGASYGLLLFGAATSANLVATRVITISATTGFFAWMNVGKIPDGDWSWYVSLYQAVGSSDSIGALGSVYGSTGSTIKSSEPFYYLSSKFLSEITGGNVAALSVAITSLIYVGVGISASYLASLETNRAGVTMITILVCMFAGITFTLTTQLVRQEIALVLALLGWLVLHRGSLFLGSISIGAAALSHNSVVIPVCAVAGAFLLVKAFPKPLFAAALGTPLLLGAGLYFVSLDAYSEFGQGSISPLTIVMDVAIVLVFALLPMHAGSVLARLRGVVIPAVLMYSAFLVGVSTQPIPFLRMYLYLEGFRVVMLAVILVILMRKSVARMLMPHALVIILILVNLRVSRSPFIYEHGTLFDYLALGPRLWLNG